jgi:hypothetical protein
VAIRAVDARRRNDESRSTRLPGPIFTDEAIRHDKLLARIRAALRRPPVRKTLELNPSKPCFILTEPIGYGFTPE